MAVSEVGWEESGVGQRVGWVPGVVCNPVEEGEEVLCVAGEGVRVEEVLCVVGEGVRVEEVLCVDSEGVREEEVLCVVGEGVWVEEGVGGGSGVGKAEALEECLICLLVALLVSNDELQLAPSREDYHPPLVGVREDVAVSGVRRMFELAVGSAWP